MKKSFLKPFFKIPFVQHFVFTLLTKYYKFYPNFKVILNFFTQLHKLLLKKIV